MLSGKFSPALVDILKMSMDELTVAVPYNINPDIVFLLILLKKFLRIDDVIIRMTGSITIKPSVRQWFRKL